MNCSGKITCLNVYWIKEVMVYTPFRPGKETGKIIINEEKMGRGIGYHWRRYAANGELQEGDVEITLLRAMRRSQRKSLGIKGKKWKKIDGYNQWEVGVQL